MATCKDCLHIDVCYMVEHYGVDIEEDRQEYDCHKFQAKTNCVEVVRCKDCKHRGEEFECPMYFVKEIEWDDDGYTEYDYVPYDHTLDDGFCDRGERREGE